jgi:hypothetical protein
MKNVRLHDSQKGCTSDSGQRSLPPAMTSLRASLPPCKVHVKFLSFRPGNCTGEGYVG